MDKLKNVYVVSCAADSAAYLVSAARKLGEKVTLITCGQAVGADKAYVLADKEHASVANYLPEIAELVKAGAPELILTDTGKDARLVAGTIAGVLNAGIVGDAGSLELKDDGIETTRMVYGGAAIKTEVIPYPAVVCVGAGIFATEELSVCVEAEEVQPKAAGIRFVEKKAAEKQSVNLAAAKRIVSVGRGLPGEEYLDIVRELGQIMDAEMGCSRPVAEEQHWLPVERYIGVSGAMLKPDIYMGIGISGQIQHMVGCNQANTIIAINKDKNAPIFQQCDYGLVADIKKVLPALAAKLK